MFEVCLEAGIREQAKFAMGREEHYEGKIKGMLELGEYKEAVKAADKRGQYNQEDMLHEIRVKAGNSGVDVEPLIDKLQR